MSELKPQNQASQSQPAAQPKYKRSVRNIFIHKPMQREFSLMLIALLMISTFAIGWVIHHTIREAAFGGGGYHFGKVSPVEILSEVSYQLVVRVSCILFLTLIVIAVFGIFFLHRVAGPLYRFRLVFMRLNEGEIPHQVKLREGDFFIETATEINRFLKKLEFEKSTKAQLLSKVESVLQAGTSHPFYETARGIKELLESRPAPDTVEKP